MTAADLSFTAQDAARLTRQALATVPLKDEALRALISEIEAQCRLGRADYRTTINADYRVVVVEELQRRGFKAYAYRLNIGASATLHVSWGEEAGEES